MNSISCIHVGNDGFWFWFIGLLATYVQVHFNILCRTSGQSAWLWDTLNLVRLRDLESPLKEILTECEQLAD